MLRLPVMVWVMLTQRFRDIKRNRTSNSDRTLKRNSNAASTCNHNITITRYSHMHINRTSNIGLILVGVVRLLVNSMIIVIMILIVI